jgi:hypothetical protein
VLEFAVEGLAGVRVRTLCQALKSQPRDRKALVQLHGIQL